MQLEFLVFRFEGPFFSLKLVSRTRESTAFITISSKKGNSLVLRRKKSAYRASEYELKLNPDRRVVIVDKKSAAPVIED